MSKPVFKQIKVVDLIPTEDNPRQANESTEQFKTLLASVKADGVKIPVVVRPHPERQGMYDLRCGARRLRAAVKAQIDKIPSLVYEGMTDEDAFDITFVENFAREDLLPMEEAKAVQILLGAHANDFAAVASKLGKPERWVRLLNNINLEMSDYFKDQLANRGDLDYFTSGHIAVITRFPADAQAAIIDHLDCDTRYSVKDLHKISANFLRILSKAPFDIEKERCIGCSKRSGYQPMLWGFGPGDKDDRCLDSGCWDTMAAKFYRDKAKDLSKENGQVKFAVLEHVAWDEQNKLKKKFKGVIFSSSIKSSGAKKEKKKTVPVLVVAGKDVGKLRWIERYSSSSASSGSSQPVSKVKTKKQLKDELDQKRWGKVVEECQEFLKGKTVQDIKHPNPTFCVIALQAFFGCESNCCGSDKGFCEIMELVKKSPAKAEKQVIEELFKAVIEQLEWQMPGPADKQGKECLQALMVLFAADIDKLFVEVCKLDEFKEPAEWELLKADGTPKADKPKAKKKAAKKKAAKKVKSS